MGRGLELTGGSSVLLGAWMAQRFENSPLGIIGRDSAFQVRHRSKQAERKVERIVAGLSATSSPCSRSSAT